MRTEILHIFPRNEGSFLCSKHPNLWFAHHPTDIAWKGYVAEDWGYFVDVMLHSISKSSYSDTYERAWAVQDTDLLTVPKEGFQA